MHFLKCKEMTSGIFRNFIAKVNSIKTSTTYFQFLLGGLVTVKKQLKIVFKNNQYNHIEMKQKSCFILWLFAGQVCEVVRNSRKTLCFPVLLKVIFLSIIRYKMLFLNCAYKRIYLDNTLFFLTYLTIFIVCKPGSLL